MRFIGFFTAGFFFILLTASSAHSFIIVNKQQLEGLESELVHPISERSGLSGNNAKIALFEIQSGNLTDAKLHLNNTLHTHPNDLRTLLMLAAIESRQGNGEAMTRWLERAFTADPTNSKSALYLARANLGHQPKKTLDVTDVALKYHVDNIPLLHVAALAQLELDRLKPAIDRLKHIIEIDAEFYEAYIALAKAYYDFAKKPLAKGTLKKLLSIEPKHVGGE